ncbi:DUF3305 domain-containing protein [Sulfitobacter guttiformis]|uniref:Uncharacterized protein DUF3305 n=1 Tax=Sulfitobacter guttiformis TaxID=74349 RepID=A0A420DJ53_9RHOB|nr:DUF3305 domain-containing protein [Sulfitobacter guttiformis]KIN71948.1 Molybdopterin-guanine dinucleotide biosynthesis protein A [Sulfitobacter guttiformis KCTC 32187]RKE94251.1 uncharacterized protein DUF3305 [Sulfitobacter guttiformis]
MPREVVRVAVLGVSHPPANKWATRRVVPKALMADIPDLAKGSLMAEQGEVRTYYMGDHAVVLHSGETAHYINNLRAAQPSLWVSCDNGEVSLVTADPYEGEAMASDPEKLVEALPLPVSIARQMQAFIAAHHVDEVFYKRKRVPATSDQDPRAPRILTDAQKWVQSRGKAGMPPKGQT